MIIKKMFKFLIFSIFVNLLASNVLANNDFNIWIEEFKIKAVNSGISKNVVNQIMSEAKYLPKVIEYDRYQPEFYEDTFTYIKKRSSKKKVKQGLKLYKKQEHIIKKLKKNLM